MLHSPEYRARFASDLKKMLPRIPFTRETADFRRFSQAGRDMARWHLGYESVEPWPVAVHTAALALDSAKDLLVQKMTFGRKPNTKGQVDKTAIIYNSHLNRYTFRRIERACAACGLSCPVIATPRELMNLQP